MHLKIQKLPYAKDMVIPSYGMSQSSGIDLMAAIDVTIPPGKHEIVPTGIKIMIQDGYEGQIRPRSGMAAKHGVTVLNSPGTIDSGYRGEIKVILINHGDAPFQIEKGMRIAQLVIAKVEVIDIIEADVFDDTERGESGFGSTGK